MNAYLLPVILMAGAFPLQARSSTCTLQAGEWSQEGGLRVIPDGSPALSVGPIATAARVRVSLEPGAQVAGISLKTADVHIEGFMPLEDLVVHARQPLRFAQGSVWTGTVEYRVVGAEPGGARLSPVDMPDWLLSAPSLGTLVPCDDMDLLTPWRGDIRREAVGRSRGDRIYLKDGTLIPVSPNPGGSSAVEVRFSEVTPAERLSQDAQGSRVILSFRRGLVLGWVPADATATPDEEEPTTDEASESEPAGQAEPLSEPPGAAEEHSQGTPDGVWLSCRKDLPLHVTVDGQDHLLGTLVAGGLVQLGSKTEERMPVLALSGVESWTVSEGASLWAPAGLGRRCKPLR